MDAQTMFSFSPLVVAIVPVVVGLVQVTKSVGLTSKYSSAMAIVMGIALVAVTGSPWQAALVQGIIVGLAASGLYSGSKTAYEEYKKSGE